MTSDTSVRIRRDFDDFEESNGGKGVTGDLFLPSPKTGREPLDS